MGAGATLVVCLPDREKDWEQSSDSQGQGEGAADAAARLSRASTGQPLAGRQTMQVSALARPSPACFHHIKSVSQFTPGQSSFAKHQSLAMLTVQAMCDMPAIIDSQAQ